MAGIDILFLAPIGSIVALSFALYLVVAILKKEEGTEKMEEIAQAVRRVYLKSQYPGVFVFFLFVFFILMPLSLNKHLLIFFPFAFLAGGLFSGLMGFMVMHFATISLSRTTYAATRSLNSGLHAVFSSGAVIGFLVMGLGLVELSVWYYFIDWYYSTHSISIGTAKINAIASTMFCYGMGANSQVLFARMCGGIFTKAADIGVDLVGKVKAGIPEDDQRNTAVIADNVGDVAGMGADLYKFYVGSIAVTSALGVAAGLGVKGIAVPMVIAAVGVIASIIGTFFVRSREEVSQSVLLVGVFTSSTLVAIISYFLVVNTLGNQHLGVYWSVLVGLVAGM